jgi:hypothetical protein
MKKNIGLIGLIGLILLIVFAMSAQATDTITVSDRTLPRATGMSKSVRVITWTFSSDDATVGRVAAYAVSSVTGMLMGFHYTPDGTNTPDAGADIQVYNHLTTGVNVLGGSCDNVGATETQPNLSSFSPIALVDETLYFYAGSLGAGTNAGTLSIFIWLP